MASAESIVDAALAALAGGRVYPDEAPPNPVKPYIVYQAAAAVDVSTLDGVCDLRNSVMQIVAWSETRKEASALMEQVIQVMCASPILAKPDGGPVSDYDGATKLRGSRLDFSFWYYV